MRRIIVIARNTFKETIRDRIMYGILIFSLLFLFSITVIGSLSLGEDLFIIRSFGLAGIYLFGLIITLFLGASLIYKEVEFKTIYIILSKPIKDSEVILGKFFGLLASIVSVTGLMGLIYLFVVWFNGGGIDYGAILAMILQVFEFSIIISVLILLSTFSSPIASTIYAVIIIYSGHLLTLMLNYAASLGGFQKYTVLGAYYLFPNLEKFNIRNLVVHNLNVTQNEFILATGYAIVYTGLALCLAHFVFQKKEF